MLKPRSRGFHVARRGAGRLRSGCPHALARRYLHYVVGHGSTRVRPELEPTGITALTEVLIKGSDRPQGRNPPRAAQDRR